MSLESFRNVDVQLRVEGLRPPGFSEFNGAAYTEAGLSRLHMMFPDLANTVFADHSDYCEALHETLRAQGIDVEDVRDPTSRVLGDQEPDYGYEWDIVTDGPVGLRFQVWLDFGRKPINLSPDVCSYVTFIQFETQLRSFLHPYRPVDEDLLQEVRDAVT